jgi:hypothetical protein
MHRFARESALVLAVLAFGLPSDTIQAQEAGWSAKDAAAIKSYTLTMDKLRRISEATAALEQLKEAREDGDEDTPPSIDAMVQRIDAVPEARAILAKHKLTTREYALAVVAGAHAAAAAELEAAGHKAEGLPVSRQQVEFYKANKTELDAMFAKQKAKAHPEDAEEDQE